MPRGEAGRPSPFGRIVLRLQCKVDAEGKRLFLAAKKRYAELLKGSRFKATNSAVLNYLLRGDEKTRELVERDK